VHEVSLARAVWRQVEAEMANHPGRRLLALDLAVGAFSGVDPESLQFAVSLVVGQSDWPDAQVRIRSDPLAMVCCDCGREFTPEQLNLTCPACGATDTDPVRGTDLRLESLHVETDDAETHPAR